MFLIRNAEPSDFKSVVRLAELLNSYNLPADQDFLRHLLKDSIDSFRNRSVPIERRRFLIVAEDIRTKKVVGCSLIIARHGTPKLPHIAFRLGGEQKRSRFLRRSIEHQTLQLTVNRSGFTEIGGLVVLPAYRHRPEQLATQLSYARFAYMAWHPEKFRPRVLVEYLPKLDSKNGNQFWRVLGAHFTHLSYHEADRLSAVDKEFILSLFPKEKIYCHLLPKSAVQDLGVPGPGAQASLRMLRRIGFNYLNQVDPFDGGPHYSAIRERISVVRNTRFYRYEGDFVCGFSGGVTGSARLKPGTASNASTMLLMVVKGGKLRAVVAPFKIKKGLVRINSDAANSLRLEAGDRVSVTPMDQ